MSAYHTPKLTDISCTLDTKVGGTLFNATYILTNESKKCD